MAASYPDVANVQKSEAHLGDYEGIVREFEYDFSRLDPLEVNN